MNILISGASGFVGYALSSRLRAAGHGVVALTRGEATSADERHWDMETRKLDLLAGDSFDAVIHLAGESISAWRWTAGKKRRIYDSRVVGTDVLARAVRSMPRPPAVFVSASAVGFYGDTGGAVVDESSPAGSLFLSQVCKAWESAVAPAREAGVRCAQLRFGIILGANGGVLKQMVPGFRHGLGVYLGSGEQKVSWVALDDAVNAVKYVLDQEGLKGPVNVTAPQVVSNRELSDALADKLSTKVRFSLPTSLVSLLFGQMGHELFLTSCAAVPKKLVEAGFRFRAPDLNQALEHALQAR